MIVCLTPAFHLRLHSPLNLRLCQPFCLDLAGTTTYTVMMLFHCNATAMLLLLLSQDAAEVTAPHCVTSAHCYRSAINVRQKPPAPRQRLPDLPSPALLSPALQHQRLVSVGHKTHAL